MGSKLEELGIPGPSFLKEFLSSCSDPLQAIEEFQRTNGMGIPSLGQMLPLLDLHGVRRHDFHNSILEELRDKLTNQINEIGQEKGRERDKKLKELLQRSFPLVKVKQLRPVVMVILKNTTHIDDKYLKVLVRDRELYNDTDTEVKRQIWRDNQSLFGDEVSPLLTQYIREKETILFDHDNLSDLFFGPSPKVRRQAVVVQKLAHMIGSNVRLYDMVLQFLRTLYVRTHNVHYCTLRSELLMALHDLEVQDIIAVDPTHKFGWCLDACMRERNVDIKRSRELQGFLDSIKRGSEQVLGDLSMILCDPYAVNFICMSATKILHHLINNEALPRENSILILLLRMLSLGACSWTIINTQEFREPKLDTRIVTRFLPALMSLAVDDQVRTMYAKATLDDREQAIVTIEHSGPLPDAVPTYIAESSVASFLTMYYTLQVTRTRDRVALMRVLGSLSSSDQDRAFDDPFLHSLVSLFIQQGDEFGAGDLCTVVFDEFFYPGLTRENVVRHVLKLLWYVHDKLPASRLDTLLKLVEPTTHHNEAVHSLYALLRERIDKSEASSRSSPSKTEFMDSPLSSVPTPAPL